MALYKRSETVRDFNGVVVSKVSVKVVTGGPYSETAPLASLFKDAAGLIPLANPLTADAAGQYSYWAAGGMYSEKVSRPGYYSITNDGFLIGGEKGDPGPQGNPGTPGTPGPDIRPQLNDGTNPANGSGMVAHNESLMYPAGSIGKALKNRLFTTDLAETMNPTTGANMVGFNSTLAYAAGTVGKFLNDLGSSIGATFIGYLAPFTGAVQRTQANKNADALSAFDFGAKADGVTDDTVAMQACITAAAATGKTAFFPAGSAAYLTTGVTVPAGQGIEILGERGTIFKAKAGAAIVVNFAGDVSRTKRGIRNVVVDGNSIANVVGIKSGNTTTATLQVYMENCFTKNCYIGIFLYSAMENCLINCLSSFNTIGIKLVSNSVNGGGNSNTLLRCQVQQNTVGVFYNGNSVYPMVNNLFSSCLIQNNSLCGMAVFGQTPELSHALKIDNTHLEANGSAGTTLVEDSRIIYKSSVTIDTAIATFTACGIGEVVTPCFKLLNGATVQLVDSWGYGTTSGTFIDGTLSETVEFYGEHNGLGQIKAHVAAWPKVFSVGRNFQAMGEPIFKTTPEVANMYLLGNANKPTLSGAIGATIADAFDPLYGPVSTAAFLNSAGSTGSNRVVIDTFEPTITSGDTWLLSMMVKASVTCDMTFAVQGGAFAIYVGPVTNKWRRLVLALTASSTTLPLLYIYPNDTTAPVISCARLQTTKVPSGGDMRLISEVMSQGLFNPMQNEFWYSGVPTTGTWKVGDTIRNTAPASAGFIGWVCTTAGTNGTYSEGLTAQTFGTTAITLSGTSAILRVGDWLTINATSRQIISINGTALVMSGTIAAAGPGLAIAYTAAVFKTYGLIS